MADGPIRARRTGEAGFAIVEVLVGMGIFAIIAIGFAGTMAASLRTQVVTRDRTVATQLADGHVELIRGMTYSDVGTVGGHPAGLLEPESAVAGTDYSLRTEVVYVDDPAPVAPRTYADYKQVTVRVVDADAGTVLARVRTVVAPPVQPDRNRAVVNVWVTEPDGVSAIPGALVTLDGGPGVARSIVTDAGGMATFASLEPTIDGGPDYRATASLSQWSTVAEDLPSVDTPALATEERDLAIRLYRPSVLRVAVVDGAGNPVPGPVDVTVSSTHWGTETVVVTDGQAVLTTVAGRHVMSGVEYTLTALLPGGSTDTERVKPTADDTDASVTLRPEPAP